MDQNSPVNVQEIMAEIRKKIKEDNLSASALSFNDIISNESGIMNKSSCNTETLRQCTEYVSARCRVDRNPPIAGSPLKCFIKKVIRKLVQFYVAPITDAQNELNAQYAAALQQINGYIQAADGGNCESVSGRMEELELKLLYSRRETEALKEQVKLLKEEIAALRGD